ncbi:MAG: DNA translocase FtsK [Candidatus Ryanbacteria bacterium]|nr:DNA translocase FtsK [Candidatus Ryanbacteria bacterium]
MAKKKPRKENSKKDREPLLAPETRDSIVAIVALVAAVLSIMAWIGVAGRVGEWAYTLFSLLLGRGYFLLPVALSLIAAALLFSLKQKFVSLPLIGAGLFLVSSLALADIGFGERTGGLVGEYTAKPMLYFFDSFASGVIFVSLIVISMLITFNASLRRMPKMLRGDEEDEEETPIKMAAPIVATPSFTDTDDEPIMAVPEPTKEIKKDDRKNVSPEIMKELKRKAADYVLPPLNLLDNDRGKSSPGDIKANSNIIQRTLQDFGIPVEMGEVSVGPSVTQYTLKPAQGVKLARILGLQNDLALALAAHPIRIEAPIPGKSFVGIEIPNRAISLVGLRSLLDREEYQRGGPLTFTLGKNVAGEATFADLAKMPHMLIAGSTGSGKSVAIHSLLMSLLYKNTPLSLRLIMIDPKRVELAHYQDLPHLLTPVITESKESISALRWAVREMEERYKILQMAKARDIVSYNSSGSHEFMPYIVIVIDELADLMASFGREVEASIVRIAQMARAVGIHLIIATQRPSVEVITGLIKANITSRMAFQVASQIDSRTIIDMAGAEKLLGNGDMLFLSGDAGKPKRVQGAFVSDNEVKHVTSFIHDQENEPAYNEEILNAKTQGNGRGGEGDDGEDDPLYEEAYAIVMDSGKASTTLLQRHLRVGYARAARIIDLLEKRGVVSPGDGAKPREILVGRSGTEDSRYVS